MTAETPTPLTDSLADCIGGYGHVYQLEQWYDLCCQFEIRCAELEAQAKLARELQRAAVSERGEDIEQKDAEIAALRRDRERLLHWLIKLEDLSGVPLMHDDPLRVEVRENIAAIRDSQTGDEEGEQS